jgi:hypothetical protein
MADTSCSSYLSVGKPSVHEIKDSVNLRDAEGAHSERDQVRVMMVQQVAS